MREQFLLHRVHARQDASAYAELYEAYVQRIYRFIFFKVNRKQEAEELTAEVFTQAWSYLCEHSVRNLNALLYRIARNRVADFYRTRKEEASLDAAVHVSTGETPEDVVSAITNKELVLTALKSINADYAQLITMRYLDELDIKEIASILGKTSNAVRVGMHRAMSALKTELSIQDHEQRYSQDSE